MAFDLDDEELRATRMMNGADRKGRVNKMKQDIKNLQEIINLCNEELDNEDENVTAVLDLVDLKSLRNLINRNKELEEENKNLKNLANNKQWISPCYVAQNYIPVSLVEETIEELKHKDFIAIQVCSQHDNKALAQIQVLQELLEKR